MSNRVITALDEAKIQSGSILQRPQSRDYRPSFDSYVSLPVENVTSAIFGGSQVTLNYLITEARVKSIKDIVLQYRITNTVGASYYIPASMFIERIEVRSNSGSGSVIQTFWGETQWALVTTLPPERQEAELKMQGFSKNMWQSSENEMAVGQTRVFGATLLAPFWRNGEFDPTTLKEGLHFRIYMRPSIVASGGGTATLDALDIIVRQRAYQDNKAVIVHNQLLQTKEQQIVFLDDLQMSFTAETLTATSERKIHLNNMRNLTGAALLFGIRSSNTSVTNQAIIDFLPLDDAFSNVAGIDFSAPGGKSIYGGGTPVRLGFQKNYVNAKSFGIKLSEDTNLYVIPFSESVKRAAMGWMNGGGFRFGDENFTLDITPGTAATSEVQTLTGAAAATAGYYQFEFMGELSQPVVYNASVATLKAAFEAISTVINYPGGISVTFGGTLAAAATATVTFGDSRSYPMIKVTTNSTAAGAVQYTVTRTTKGNGGWTTGSTYNVEAHLLYFRRMHISNGRIRVENI